MLSFFSLIIYITSELFYPAIILKRDNMEDMQYFYELFCGLPRGGPGDNKSTRKAFGYLKNLPTEPLILDIGCGHGIQTLELAKISKGKIIAIDNYQPFLDILKKKAKEARDWLREMCLGKSIYLDSRGADKYGRWLGNIFTQDGTCLNEELVRLGYAVSYDGGKKNQELLKD